MSNEQIAQQPAGAPAESHDRSLAEQLLQEGLDHYDGEDFEQALDSYQRALQADPTFSLAHNNLGMVLIDMEQYDEAVEALWTSIQITPDFAEAYSNLGFALRRVGQDLNAAITYNKFLELEPDVEEGDRIREWIQQVCTENGLQEIPPFEFSQEEEEPPPQAEVPQVEAPPAQAPEPQLAIPQEQPPMPEQGAVPPVDPGMGVPQEEATLTLGPGGVPGGAPDIPAQPGMEGVAQDEPATLTLGPGGVPGGTPETPAQPGMEGTPPLPPALPGTQPPPMPPALPGTQPPPMPVAPVMPDPAFPPQQPAAEEPEEEDAAPKIQKMAAWEAVMSTPETAAAVSATGDYVEDEAAVAQEPPPMPGAEQAPPPMPGAEQAPPPIPGGEQAPPPDDDLIEFQDGEMMVGQEQQPASGGIGIAAAKALETIVADHDVTALIEQGMDQFSEGDLEGAEQTFIEALRLDPVSSEAHTGLGKALVRLERMDEGMEKLRVAIELDEMDPAPYYVLGFALRGMGEDQEAASIYERFLALLPQAEDAERIQEWIQHVRDGGAAVAEEEYEEIPQDQVPQEQVPQEELPQEQPAFAPEGDDDLEFIGEDDGSSQLHAAVDQEVEEEDEAFKRPKALFQDGDMDGALNACVKLLNEDPAHYRSRVLLGRIYLRQKQYPEAIEQLEGALVTCPDFPEALYYLGQACERSGEADQARSAYQRCVEVAPQGPRAEQLREWLLAQSGIRESSAQVQCELCLRLFPDMEITEQDGKKTCQGCMALLSGSSQPTLTSDSADADTDGRAEVVPEEDDEDDGKPEDSEQDVTPGKKSKGMVLAYVMVAIMVLLAVGVTYLPSILDDGQDGNGIEPVPGNGKNGSVTTSKVDWSKVIVENEPDTKLLPLRPWSFAPKLGGLHNAPKDLLITYSLKKSPKGMTVDDSTGALTWTPPLRPFDALLMGFREVVELEIKGILAQKPDAPVFNISHKMLLSYQFGYFLGQELEELAVNQGDHVVFTRGDFNGDGTTDFVLGSGQFGKGVVRFRLSQEKARPKLISFKVPGLIGALCRTDLNGDGKDDLLVANRYSGKVKSFVQNDTKELKPGPELSLERRGPVALTVSDLDGDKNLEIAALLGLGRAIVICGRDAEGKFSQPKLMRLRVGGPRGWVFPWRSDTERRGFLAITPLDPNPFRFIPWKDAKAGAPIREEFTVEGLIVGAVLIPAADETAVDRILLCVNKDEKCQVLCLAPKAGRLAPLEGFTPIPLDGLALSLTTVDMNLDKLDDLMITFPDQVVTYLKSGDAYVPGPVYKELGTLDGAVGIAELNEDGRPDIMLVTTDGKVMPLLSRVAVPKFEEAAELWPDGKEVKAVKLGPSLKFPTEKLWISFPDTLKHAFSPRPEVDFEAVTEGDATSQGKIILQVKKGAPKPLDEAALKELEKKHVGMEWVGKPIEGQMGASEAVRVEGRVPGKNHYVWYVVAWGENHVRIELTAPDSVWKKVKLPLEACARSLKTSE